MQLYKVVFGLEVLGNPVGFLSGLTEGTIGLFYQPIQVPALVLVHLVHDICRELWQDLKSSWRA